MFVNEPVSKYPNITEITFKPINKKYLKVILWNVALIFSLIFVGLFLVDFFVLFEEINNYFYLFYIVYIFILILTVSLKTIGFKKRKFAVREKDISYKSGIFFKKLTTVPFSRIQHIEVDEGPLSRVYKLASLSVFTAGDSSDDLVIKGIKKETAIQIKEFISTKINE